MNLLSLHSGPPSIGPCILGLGTFDGVHRGHQTLIQSVREEARRLGLPSVLFTFDHSPRRLLSPKSFLGEITTPEEKFQLLLGSGVDWVVFRSFDATFAAVSPEEFIQSVILEQLRAQAVWVGFNFGFGLRRQGTATSLAQILDRHGRQCHVLAPVVIDQHVVSSTLIREAIAEGNFTLATHLLRREVCFSGEVVHGDHRGRELGFPTANLDLGNTSKVIPPRGVYFCEADTARGSFSALVNIGVRPTFGRERPLLEAHLLDFTGDLYHQTIRIRFQKRLRGEVRFPDASALTSQIQSDLVAARQLIKIVPRPHF